MIALEFKEKIEVSTSKGDGYIWYMINYGPNSDTWYAIIIKESGECWKMTHKDFRVKSNINMGIRGSCSKPSIKHGSENGVKQGNETPIININKS